MSRLETLEHIRVVRQFLRQIINNLDQRASVHDQSKLEEPELSIFDEYTPKLRNTTYGSEQYRSYLNEMSVALKHHYEHNRHHPEHFENGIEGMTLLDLIEMFCDWKAATLRHEDGDLNKSIEINKDRFAMSNQLAQIFRNTQKEMGW